MCTSIKLYHWIPNLINSTMVRTWIKKAPFMKPEVWLTGCHHLAFVEPEETIFRRESGGEEKKYNNLITDMVS